MFRSTRTPSPRSGRSGFTLIELLVVIAIIAILAAILFPVFAQAREAARKSQCASNLKQLSLAIMQYTQDYDEMYPMGYYGFSASGTSLSWATVTQPYIKNSGVFKCPSAPLVTGNTPGVTFPVTYAYNYYIGGNNNPSGGIMTASLPQVNKPADTVLVADSGTTPVANVDPTQWALKLHSTNKHTAWLLVHAGSSTIGFVDYGAPAARHAGISNVVWADGHVKAMKVEKFYLAPGQTSTNPVPPAGAVASWSPCLDPLYGCP